jgi:hypothetical protein
MSTTPTRAPEEVSFDQIRFDAELRQPGDAEGGRRPVRTYSSLEAAFPRHVDYAYAGRVYKRRLSLDERVGLVVLILGLLGAAVVAWGQPKAPPTWGCTTDTECRCTVDCLEPANPPR